MLEQIYENQLYKSPKDELKEKHLAVMGNLNSVLFSILKCKLFYQNLGSFYKTDLGKLEQFEDNILELKEEYNRQFIEHSFLQHPNPETRKDIMG